jgi:hypothetical protein
MLRSPLSGEKKCGWLAQESGFPVLRERAEIFSVRPFFTERPRQHLQVFF